jgi:gliding motility-associated-like protein
MNRSANLSMDRLEKVSMNGLLTIALVFIFSLCTYSQTIVYGEYFFDSDPGVGNGLELSFLPAASINQTFNVPTGILTEGFHTFNTRFVDNTGKWSLFSTRTFYIIPNPFSLSPSTNITKAEYFYDIDPGIGNGVNIPVTANPAINLTINTPTTALTAGFHTVNMRVRDDKGRWSLFTTRTFYLMPASVLPANLVKLEYYVDTDPGIGQATSVSIAQAPTVNQLFNLNLPVLTPGSYTLNVRAKDSNGFWSSRVSAPFTITPCTPPTPPTSSGASRCGVGTIDITANGASGAQVYRWYADAATTTILFTGPTFTTPSLNATTTYHVSIFDPATCESSRILVTATINSLPTAPTTIGASACVNASVSLTASGGSNGQYSWYTIATGGTAITGEVNSSYSTPVLNSTTNYFVTLTSGGCESTRTQVTATIVNVTPPTTVGASACAGSTFTLTASGGTNGQYKWYTVATGGTAIVGEVNSAYTTPSLSATTIYYVTITTSGCESTRTPVSATVITTSAPTAVGSSACPNSSITLTASGGSNGQYKWYTVATGGTAIVGEINSTYTTPSLTATTIYYVTITTSGCESPRTQVTATILSTGCAPVITTATLATQVEGTVILDLKSLITTVGTLDVNSIKVKTPPSSGAAATIANGVLTIDYKGKPFSGIESITIEACNTNGICSQQTFSIEVAGDIVVYNAVSPNGDDKNEFLYLKYIEVIAATSINQVMIYNRWGDEVFSVSDYDNKTRRFAGLTNDGSKLPVGTYFYKIVLPNAGKTMTGYLELKY